MTTHPTIILRTQSPFFRLFPDGEVPVTAPLPQPTILGAEDDSRIELAYMLDFSRVSLNKVDEIVRVIQRERQAGNDEVRGQVLSVGLPIRENQVAKSPAVRTRFAI